MAKVKLQISYKDQSGEAFKQILAYINPDCDDANLADFVAKLNSLTTNKVDEVLKIVQKFLSENNSDTITLEEMQAILNGTFQPDDDEVFTATEINSILDGTFTPIEDDDTWSEEDFKF